MRKRHPSPPRRPRLTWRDVAALLAPVTRHPNRRIVVVGRVSA